MQLREGGIVNKLIVIAAAVCLSGAAQAQSLQVQRPVPYAEDNDIADNIKNECKINEEIVDSLKEHAASGVEFTSGAVDTGSGRVLQLEIVDAVSMGNAWLGHQKYMKVKGALYEGGKKVAGFKGRRNSMGGAFAGYKGSCSVLGRTAEALGEDIATWLQAPQDGANLGD
jgi:hypothetical protein